MQIMLRGKKVRTTVITKSLSKTEVDTYRPSVRENTPVIPANVSFHLTIIILHRNSVESFGENVTFLQKLIEKLQQSSETQFCAGKYKKGGQVGHAKWMITSQ